MRNTDSDLESLDERFSSDIWPLDGATELSDWWTGKTLFYLRMPAAKPGHQWVLGRETQIKSDSQRPGDVWPEHWV